MLSYATVFPEVKKSVSYLFGEQVSLSYPMPDVTRGIWVERYFLYPAGNSIVRSRPFGLLTVSMENGQILAYQDCRINDFMDTEKYPFSEKISYALPRKIGVKQFKVEQSLINKLYDSVREFSFKEELAAEQKQMLQKYMALLLQSIPAALHPYYQKMGKNFYRWGYIHV